MSVRSRVSFRFDGHLAEYGELDGSDFMDHIVGARRLLALQAAYYTTGRVADPAQTETSGYHVRWANQFEGAAVDAWNVIVHPRPDMLQDALGDFSLSAASYEFYEFFRDCVGQTVQSLFWRPPQIEKVEALLRCLNQSSDELFPYDGGVLRSLEILQAYTRHALIRAARPVGRSAETLDIYTDGLWVGEIDVPRLRNLKNEHAICEHLGLFQRGKEPPRLNFSA